MQVIRINLKSPKGGEVEASVLFDGGSNPLFITESLVRGLQLQKSGEEYFAFSGFGGMRRLVANPRLQGAYNENLKEMEQSGIIEEWAIGTLGFLSPYIATAKFWFQELWELGKEWDDELPDQLRDRFRKWLHDLDVLLKWKTGADRVRLHIFCDSSEKAYGFCTYLWLQEGKEVKVSLVMSKSYSRCMGQFLLTGDYLFPGLHGGEVGGNDKRETNLYGQLEVGSVVLVREDNCPRLQWPIGGIDELIKGRDGIIRTVKERTKTGCFTRPIQRLHDMELHAHPVIDTLEPGTREAQTTRYGRQSRTS
ncbi:hypothetical protein PoB_000030600 [Plakobranchus ocellatus]|uniref:DUF5641 domain-containing protein n=1 Tax=Plakobranchus ocellatus TaxID=259542 RepID=A0AAV3XRS6_9GAST|nr:hypothetical protein PoB_000030600 [Plakobranchus ocellatus]